MNKNKKLVHHSLQDSPIPLYRAFQCAFEGVIHAIKTQRNFLIHLTCAIVALIISYMLKLSHTEIAIIVICIFVVFSFELVNTAIESIVDLVSPEWEQLAKHAKDCAAGSVLLVSIMSIVVALHIFIPAILKLF